ncbi:hypothetical protein [Candidatus Electronema sp. PJ]|uniref:hypothetical protein n=1 Tax=Candidatus Electronema sp. PJ TaxID=3401572 RepID=UPI003AA819B4
MSITHLIIFLLQFFFLVPALFWFFKKSTKGSRKRKILLVLALASVCYASLDAYFHRYLIGSDIYYVLGDWKKSGDIAERGFNYTENKSELHEFLYGRYSLYRKIKRAKEKEKPDSKQAPQPE